MTQKYNLALRPKHKSFEFIAVARQFSHLVWQYQLSENSFPHVTLYQFRTDPEKIPTIWEQVKTYCKFPALKLIFNEFACKTFADKTLHWISLMPDQRDVLQQMHETIAGVIEHPVKENFDPHLTLLNTRGENYLQAVDTVAKNYRSITDEFELTLGRSDQIGQYVEILFK